MDKRLRRLGKLLVDYSTGVKPGERVLIVMVEPETFELASCVYEAAVQAGGYPQIVFSSEQMRRSLLTCGTPEQASWVPELEEWGTKWADVHISLRGAHNLYELQDVSPRMLALNQSAMGKISTLRWEHTRWCLVRVPTQAFAQQARCDFETVLDMFFDSCFLDWKAEAEKWALWCRRLEKAKTVRIKAPGTDLSFSVAGRRWIPFAGHNNMPDGEIATAPVCETVNGTIVFDTPGVLSGRLIEGISLTWEKGVLTKAESKTEGEFFQSIIKRDSGSSSIGEFAIGTNRAMTRFCNDILFDEKIWGTMHIALGRAYPECGGTNQSAIHWDIVKDMRKAGEIFLDDDECILQNGEILL